jgi:DNA topoisomerase-1
LSYKDVDASKLTLEEVQEMIAKKKHLAKKKVAAKKSTCNKQQQRKAAVKNLRLKKK